MQAGGGGKERRRGLHARGSVDRGADLPGIIPLVFDFCSSSSLSSLNCVVCVWFARDARTRQQPAWHAVSVCGLYNCAFERTPP